MNEDEMFDLLFDMAEDSAEWEAELRYWGMLSQYNDDRASMEKEDWD